VSDPTSLRRPPPSTRAESWRLVDVLSETQSGALGRRQLVVAGVPRWLVRNELRARRWQRFGRQVVVTHNGDIGVATRRWAALLEVGCRAALDGVTALQVAGITALTDEEIHVITPKSSTPQKPAGAVVHESRRFREEDVLPLEPRRVRPAVAAVHAALWARTDREATYVVMLVVQQRHCSVAELAEAVEAVRRAPRRRLLRQLVGELAGGALAMSEIDVARDFRAAGLPEPDRQVPRERAGGRRYLDCRLEEFGLTLELDGAGHDDPLQRLDDLVRDIGTLAEGEDVVRIPMAAYRLDRARVLAAIAELLRARGWRPAA
jgi:hypothetical protein